VGYLGVGDVVGVQVEPAHRLRVGLGLAARERVADPAEYDALSRDEASAVC
jgi:hypothetical protein